MHGFDNWIIAHAVWLEILPSIVKCWIIVVVGVLDDAGTYESGVLPFKLLVGYNKFSFNYTMLGNISSQTAWAKFDYQNHQASTLHHEACDQIFLAPSPFFCRGGAWVQGYHTVEQMRVASLLVWHMYWTSSDTKEAFSILLLFSIWKLLVLSLKQFKKLVESM